jgi:lysophospholipase L1-like esterase
MILAINVALLTLGIATVEVFLRFYLPYNPTYYMWFEEAPGVYRMPYGLIKQNSLGFPDDEFDRETTKRRIGYFGDSVTQGVGAGHGYRITDILEGLYPTYAHWTFAGTRDGVDKRGATKILELSDIHKLDVVVYLLNLNDILPSDRFADAEMTWVSDIKSRLRWLDKLRGRSYVYSLIRKEVRLFLAARGYGYHGWKAADLFPVENAPSVQQTAQRVNAIAEKLKRRGVAFAVILLPYEMQISRQAEERYWELGIRWEQGFTYGLTQKMLIDQFDDELLYFDAREAFLRRGNPLAPSEKHKVGQYFVYNRGDALDWNHPNRDGHKVIATWLAEQDFLGDALRRRPSNEVSAGHSK